MNTPKSKDDLVQLINVIIELSSENAFRQMFAFFAEMNRLDKEDILAVWFAVQMFKTSPSVKADAQILVIENAIISRMVAICMSVNMLERDKLKNAFVSAFPLHDRRLVVLLDRAC